MIVDRPLLLITGVAEGFGASLAATFAREGYDVAGLARSNKAADLLAACVAEQGGRYVHLCCDISRAESVSEVLAPYAASVAVLVHNAHKLMIKPFMQTSPDEIAAVWSATCLGAMNTARAVVPAMIARGEGHIIFSGATASIRGGANFAAFAAAKFALRGFAQSLAREHGSNGVHVAHVILDGLIDEPQTTARFGEGRSHRMSADSVAAAYLALVRQDRSAWTHELDLRPSLERF
jgi:short-subunit dehydrogenase